MPNTVTIGMEMGGNCRLNVSSKPPGSSDERSVAELNRLGLEHFGFDVEGSRCGDGAAHRRRHPRGASDHGHAHGLQAVLHRGARTTC